MVRQWGAIQGLKDDPEGDMLQASVVQALSSQTFTAYVDIVPVQSTDVAPPEDRETKKMLVTFIDEHFRTDANISVLGECLKYGAVRSAHLTGWPPQDKIYTCEVLLDVERISQSKLLGDLFKSIVSDLIFVHLTLRKGSWYFSGGGGSIFSEGGVHPNFLQIA
jgi:hypothetical protein